MLISDWVKVKWNPANIKHFKSKGYFYTKMGDEFLVKVEDLSEGSNIDILVLCDYCGIIINRSYNDYLSKNINSIVHKDCCKKCKSIKIKESNMIIYNVDSTNKLSEVKQKTKNTCLDKYGVECTFQSEKIKEKLKQTMLDKYGKKNYTQTKEYIDKTKQTCLDKYGVEFPSQNEEIQGEIRQSFYKNGACQTSSQQLYIYNLLKDNGYNVKLNYPLSRINLDIGLFIGVFKINI